MKTIDNKIIRNMIQAKDYKLLISMLVDERNHLLNILFKIKSLLEDLE